MKRLACLLLVLPLMACTPAVDDSAITVDNCGQTVTFDAPPERVALIDSAPVATLDALDLLDRVVTRAGVFPPEYYSATTNERLAEIPSLTDRIDATGHLLISVESIVAAEPDLVLGSTDTVNRATLANASINNLDEPAYCGALDGEASFEDVYQQVHLLSTVFGTQAAGDAVVDKLRERVAGQIARVPAGESRSVAVLYPSIGSGVTYAYGTGSMSHPLVSAAGLRNVFADSTERVFEVSAEEIIARQPDVILALYTAGPAPDVTIPGVDAQVVPLLLNFAEPPTPLAVDGLTQLLDALA